MSRFAWRLPSQRLRPRRAPAREHMAVFMAGLPGSGKTRVIDGRYGLSRSTTLLLDLDTEIIHHPKYDPDDPPAVYASAGAYTWADERVEEKFQAALCRQQSRANHPGEELLRLLARVRTSSQQTLQELLPGVCDGQQRGDLCRSVRFRAGVHRMGVQCEGPQA